MLPTQTVPKNGGTHQNIIIAMRPMNFTTFGILPRPAAGAAALVSAPGAQRTVEAPPAGLPGVVARPRQGTAVRTGAAMGPVHRATMGPEALPIRWAGSLALMGCHATAANGLRIAPSVGSIGALRRSALSAHAPARGAPACRLKLLYARGPLPKVTAGRQLLQKYRLSIAPGLCHLLKKTGSVRDAGRA
mmetsp:Transcript_26578/g.81841  ORF Transcript_26578/g.81841 Transcript_26578/m.81841 type:complete len:190 (+) Transcript_26578:196-765(+)